MFRVTLRFPPFSLRSTIIYRPRSLCHQNVVVVTGVWSSISPPPASPGLFFFSFQLHALSAVKERVGVHYIIVF